MTPKKGANPRKRPAAARVSRNKKKYWRKGADVAEIEEAIIDKDKTVSLTNLPDEQIFTIDREPAEPDESKKFTRKQQAALNKISLLANRNDEDVKEKTFPKRPLRPTERLPRPNFGARKVCQPSAGRRKIFDLWETDLQPKLVDLVPDAAKDGAAYLLKQTKKVQPKMPKTLKVKPSLLKAVEVPEAGASYNPDFDTYEDYVAEIVADEMEKIIKEEKAERRKKLAPGESYVTHEDKWKEVIAGLEDESDDEVKVEAEGEVEAESFLTGPIEVNPKTRRQRRKQKEEKEKQQKRLAKKVGETKESTVYQSKKMLKEIALKQKEHTEKLKKRKDKKVLEDVTKRKKLGRGQFAEEETPFLLTEEMTGSLRQLKPQGNLLSDRMRSLQKRNILPIAGERNQHRLKAKLKFKLKENRSHKEVKQGTVLR